MNTDATKWVNDVKPPKIRKSASITCEVPLDCFLSGIKLQIAFGDPGSPIRSYYRSEHEDGSTYALRFPASATQDHAGSVELNLTFDDVMDAIQLLNEMRDHILDPNADEDQDEG